MRGHLPPQVGATANGLTESCELYMMSLKGLFWSPLLSFIRRRCAPAIEESLSQDRLEADGAIATVESLLTDGKE